MNHPLPFRNWRLCVVCRHFTLGTWSLGLVLVELSLSGLWSLDVWTLGCGAGESCRLGTWTVGLGVWERFIDRQKMLDEHMAKIQNGSAWSCCNLSSMLLPISNVVERASN